MKRTTQALALTAAMLTITTLGLAAMPAQAAAPPQYRYGIVPGGTLTPAQETAVKADALAKWKKMPKVIQQAAPARPPVDPPDTGIPPTLTVKPYATADQALTTQQPTEWEVLALKSINQCFPDNHVSAFNFGVSHLSWCTKQVARAVVWDIFGTVVSEAPMVQTTIITTMDPGYPTRQVRAALTVWVGETTGSIDPGQVDNGPIRFVMRCTPGSSATGCTVGGNPDGRTRSVSEWRADTTGVTEWTFDAPSGDGWSQGPRTDRAAWYNIDSFGEWVNGTNSTWGATSFRCDYSPSMAQQLNGTWLNPTGCVFPSGRDTFSRLSLTDPEVVMAAEHIDLALRSPSLTIPPPSGKAATKVIPGTTTTGPLTRFYSATAKTSRTRVTNACRNFDPNYGMVDVINGVNVPWECDEYPFASTYENASNGGDFSVRMMPKAQNGKAGNYLNGWYNAFRYLDGDRFYVAVRP